MSTCANTLRQKIDALMRNCERLRENSSNDVIKSCYSKLAELNSRDSEETYTLLHFKDYAKVLLDFTYFQENELAEDDFKSVGAEKEVLSIIDNLNGLEQLCQEYFQSDVSGNILWISDYGYTVQQTLGTEMAECILWRKGALFYMFCQSKHEDKEWIRHNQQTFTKFLCSGIMYLSSMLSFRRPIKREETDVISNLDVLALIEKGIFSDCHLLALMYAGEMCYWYLSTTSTEVCLLSKEHARKMGENFLVLYISAVEGPLKGQGWNADRAKELLGTFVLQK